MKVITNNGIYSEFCILYEITDESMDKINGGYKYYEDVDFMVKIGEECGDNAFLITIQCDIGFKSMRKYLGDLLMIYKTVSWHNRDYSKIYSSKRREICHN